VNELHFFAAMYGAAFIIAMTLVVACHRSRAGFLLGTLLAAFWPITVAVALLCSLIQWWKETPWSAPDEQP
jgi:uncharacterized iron-regulated membrane protein